MMSQQDLKIISDCPVCNTHNFPAKISLLRESAQSHLLHVQCRKCLSKIIILVTLNPNGMASVGLLTELNSDEVVKFSKGEVISNDDLLDLYQELIINKKEIAQLV